MGTKNANFNALLSSYCFKPATIKEIIKAINADTHADANITAKNCSTHILRISYINPRPANNTSGITTAVQHKNQTILPREAIEPPVAFK